MATLRGPERSHMVMHSLFAYVGKGREEKTGRGRTEEREKKDGARKDREYRRAGRKTQRKD